MKPVAIVAGITIGVLAFGMWAVCAVCRELGEWEDPFSWPCEDEERL